MTSGHPVSSLRARAAGAILIVVVAFSSLVPGLSSAAPVGFQASVGWDPDFLVGAGVRFEVAPLALIPNAELVFTKGDGYAYRINFDGTMTVMPLAVATGYLGAGIGFLRHTENSSLNETVVNVIAGAGLNAIPYKPFAQFKWVVQDGDDPLVFSIGARF